MKNVLMTTIFLPTFRRNSAASVFRVRHLFKPIFICKANHACSSPTDRSAVIRGFDLTSVRTRSCVSRKTVTGRCTNNKGRQTQRFDHVCLWFCHLLKPPVSPTGHTTAMLIDIHTKCLHLMAAFTNNTHPYPDQRFWLAVGCMCPLTVRGSSLRGGALVRSD
jgi:hypothetical protein